MIINEAPMYQRIMELLVLLMDEFGRTSFQSDQMDHLSEDLLRRGYTEHEINAAFFWLYHRFWEEGEHSRPRTLDLQEPSNTSHRVLNSFEQRYIKPEAYGYLLQLRNLQLIDGRELERIIERAFMLDAVPAGLEEIKMVVQSLLFDDNAAWSGNRPIGPIGQSESFH
jgi:uncharacterized protein Smg (DUF494 family)